MKKLFQLVLLGLAIWGCFNIQWNNRSVSERAMDYVATKDMTVDGTTAEKIKSMFPSWTKEKYQVFIQKAER